MKNNDMKSELIQRYNVSTEQRQKEQMCHKWMKTSIVAAAAMLILVIVLMLSSCEKKELCMLPHPHDKKICHTTLTMSFDNTWGDDIITSTYADDGQETGFNTRYILEFWALNEENELDTLIEHREVSDGKMYYGANTYTVDVDLPAAHIAVMCWAEPVNAATRAANPNFNTADLRQVQLRFCGIFGDKDAFTASDRWDLTPYKYERDGITLPGRSLALERPFGRYRLISNDVKEYYEKNGADAPLPATAKISYQLWVPMTYDVYAQTPVDPIAGQGYSYAPYLLNEDELVMAEDIIFVPAKDKADNYFNFVSSCYAADGRPIHESGNVEARIRQNRTTLIYGALLTNRKTNSPGVDDSFDDEIVVVIPD